MRNIDADIWTELNKEEFMPFLLFEATIDGDDYKYTDCDVALVLGGDVYSPRKFTLSDVKYSSMHIVDQVEISMTNLDDIMSGIFTGGTPQGSEVILRIVVLELSGRYQPVGDASLILFQGEIDSWIIDEEDVSIVIATPFSRWNQRTVRRHASSCRWKTFKGTECGYAGAGADCDRTYARCSRLGNTINFGGFRWLLSIMDKEIWWGRERATE